MKDRDQIKKFFADREGDDAIALSEISSQMPYSEKYLSEMARCGKLKAFMASGDWFTTQSWINDFNNIIKNDLENEMSTLKKGNKLKSSPWVVETKDKNGFVSSVPIFVSGLILFLCFLSSATAILLAGSPEETAYTLSVVNQQINEKNNIIATNFIKTTDTIYGYPIVLSQKFSGEKIKDEILTEKWYDLVLLFDKIMNKNTGQVAGEQVGMND